MIHAFEILLQFRVTGDVKLEKWLNFWHRQSQYFAVKLAASQFMGRPREIFAHEFPSFEAKWTVGHKCHHRQQVVAKLPFGRRAAFARAIISRHRVLPGLGNAGGAPPASFERFSTLCVSR